MRLHHQVQFIGDLRLLRNCLFMEAGTNATYSTVIEMLFGGKLWHN